jgi:hypothetical protein
MEQSAFPSGVENYKKLDCRAKAFIFKTLLSFKAALTGDWITKESVTGEQRDATSGHEGAESDRGPEILTQTEELSYGQQLPHVVAREEEFQ